VGTNQLQWTYKDETLLYNEWGKASKTKLTSMFPTRTWRAIYNKGLALRGAKARPRIKDNQPWTQKDRDIIKKYWGHLDKRIIRDRYLPWRSIPAVEGQARRLGLTTPRPVKICNISIIQQLTRERKMVGWSRLELADRSGYTEAQISDWERGNNLAGLPKLIDWAQALGFDLVLIPMEEN